MDKTERFIEEELRRESERIERETSALDSACSDKTYDDMLTKIHRSIEDDSILREDSRFLLLDELDKCTTLSEAAALRDQFCQRIIDKYREAVNRLTGMDD